MSRRKGGPAGIPEPLLGGEGGKNKKGIIVSFFFSLLFDRKKRERRIWTLPFPAGGKKRRGGLDSSPYPYYVTNHFKKKGEKEDFG